MALAAPRKVFMLTITFFGKGFESLMVAKKLSLLLALGSKHAMMEEHCIESCMIWKMGCKGHSLPHVGAPRIFNTAKDPH